MRKFWTLLMLFSCMAHLAWADMPTSQTELPSYDSKELLYGSVNGEEGDNFFVDFIRTLAVLGSVLGVLLVGVWFLKRYTLSRIDRGNSDSAIQIVEQRMLSPKAHVHLLHVGGKRIVVGESATGLTLLSEMAQDE